MSNMFEISDLVNLRWIINELAGIAGSNDTINGNYNCFRAIERCTRFGQKICDIMNEQKTTKKDASPELPDESAFSNNNTTKDKG